VREASCAEGHGNLESKPPGTLWATAGLLRDCFTFTFFLCTFLCGQTTMMYKGADKSSARPTSRCVLFVGENISFDASLVIYIYIYIYI
jgi:hypothetical protein